MKITGEILKTAIFRLLIIFNMPYKRGIQYVLQMNGRATHTFAASFKLVIFLTVLCSGLALSKLSAQNTLQLNGRTLLLQEGKYYEVTTKDTIKIDVQNVLVKFKPGQENIGTAKLVNEQGLLEKYHISDNELHYKLPASIDFISAITTLLNTNEVNSVGFGYLLKANTRGNNNRASSNIGSGTMGNNTASGEGRSWPHDEQQMDFWELIKTNITDDYSGNNNNAWFHTVGDPSVIVAVIDNGLVWDDADFSPANTLGFDYFDGDPDVTPIVPTNLDIEMGTAVASVIAARTSNGHAMYGIAGGCYMDETSPPITLMVLRAFSDNNEYSTLAVEKSIRHAVDHGARIINLDLILEEENIDIANAISYASAKGAIIFSPAGDNGNYKADVDWPASRADVIAVGGTDLNDKRAKWGLKIESSWGAGTEISLPAEDIEVRDIYGPDGVTPGSWVISTTQISCAMATGIAALIISANPCLAADQIKEILIKSCEKVGGYSYNAAGWCPELGYGRVNAGKAVELAKGLYTTTIENNTNWESARCSGNIIINPGVTLTLNNMTLQMADEKFITVGIGGKLIVNGSVITTACNTTTHRWGGIHVVGKGNVSNNNINQQGYVKILNNSLIENARLAVNVISEEGPGFNYAGGIIIASNSTFKNNDQALFFGEYYYNSGSFYDHCSFYFDQNYFGTVAQNQALISLVGNKGLKFYGCTFTNYKTANTGVGIQTAASSFSMNGGCTSNQISPCPANMLIYNTFENLNYGIYSNWMNGKTVVQKTNFVNNNCGAYFSNNYSSELLDCDFNVPEQNDNVFKYGAYYDQCSGYHIEGNKFRSESTSNTSGNSGLWLHNSGTVQNYVYRNTFTNLSRGAISLGQNRSNGGSIGLCFKCNDFSQNGTDIDIVLPNNNTATNLDGIALNQGLPTSVSSSNKDTLAACNTFSFLNTDNNLRNRVGLANFSNYYFQEHNYTAYRIIPYTDPNINKITNNQTTYDRTSLCKPWSYNGNIIQIQAQKSAAKAGADSIEQQLQAVVDGGSTDELTMDVLGAFPSEALDLRNELIAKSPYLSDTVMKTAVDLENTLPNALLRDVLVENPQAAKNEDIMLSLDNRWDPMPDEMKDEIAAGKETLGGRELLEAKRDSWKQQEGLLFDRMVSTCLGDTLNPYALSTLYTFLQNEQTPRASLLLANMRIQKHEYAEAAQVVSALQATNTLSELDTKEANDYLSLIGILTNLKADSISPMDMDSIHALPMFALYQSGSTQASAIARNYLVASGLLVYHEPFDSETWNKSLEVHQDFKPHAKKQLAKELFHLQPNPAMNYTVADYTLPVGSEHGSLRFVNVNGTIVKQIELHRPSDQVTIDLQEIGAGTYMVVLQSGNKVMESKSFNIVK